MKINAIRTHLNGILEVSCDRGKTWQAFKGTVINQAYTESATQFNELRRQLVSTAELYPQSGYPFSSSF